MTRLRRARLAGALVALGILLCPELLRDSSFGGLFFNYRSFRPRSLISPAARDRWKDVPNRSEREKYIALSNSQLPSAARDGGSYNRISNWPRTESLTTIRRALARPTSLDDP